MLNGEVEFKVKIKFHANLRAVFLLISSFTNFIGKYI